MKKIVVISSSPRRGGNSDTLCDQFINGAQETGHFAEKIFLREYQINYCTGCGTCYNGVKPCPQKDDMAEILHKMIAADVIVLASPIYFYTMCGQLKTMIDRCCARYTEMRNKEFYYILTAADSVRASVERAVTEFRGFLDCLDDPQEKGTIYGIGAWNIGDVKSTPAMREAYEMGKNI